MKSYRAWNPLSNKWVALDKAFDSPDQAPLLGNFCSSPTPELHQTRSGNQTLLELPEGPVGNTASLDCIYGAKLLGFDPTHRDEHNDTTGQVINIITPVEHLHLDFLFHESLEWLCDGEFGVYGLMSGGANDLSWMRESNRMPIPNQLTDLGKSVLEAAATPHVPNYRALVEHAFTQAGWNPAEFFVRRFVMTYPPIPTVAFHQAELPGSV